MALRQNIRILIVDDFPMFLQALRDSLVRKGFHYIEEARNGAEALGMLRTKSDRYDLVISDWHMQPVDGVELLKIVRADAKLDHVPFIIASAEGSPEGIKAVLAAGASNYLPKPFSDDALEAAIVLALAGS